MARSWLLPGTTGLYHLGPLIPFFSVKLSQITQTVKSNISKYGWVRHLVTNSVATLSLPSVLVKTDGLFDTTFLCLSFLVLCWLGIEPILGFSFIQGVNFPFNSSLQNHPLTHMNIKSRLSPTRAAITSGLGCSLPYHSIFFLLSISFFLENLAMHSKELCDILFSIYGIVREIFQIIFSAEF